MGFSNGRGSINFHKKSGIYKNSTGSCKIDQESGLAYSYGEKIAVINREGSWALFNSHSFSVTTARHQRIILNFLIDKLRLPRDRIFCLDLTSLNNFDGKTIESIKDQVKSLGDLEKLYHCKPKILDFSGKELSDIKSKLDQDFKDRKAYEKKERLRDRLRSLNYATSKNYKKALNDLLILSNSRKVEIKTFIAGRVLKLSLLENLLNDPETAGKIDASYCLRDSLENLIPFSSPYHFLNFEDSFNTLKKLTDLYLLTGEKREIFINSWRLENLLSKLYGEQKKIIVDFLRDSKIFDLSQANKLLNEIKTAEIFGQIGG